MKRFLTLFASLLLALSISAQYNASNGKAIARKGEWRNGFTAAKAHKTTDWAEFANQYAKNKATWDSVFNWLATQDLEQLAEGKYPICGNTYARIQVATTRPEQQCNIESHRKYIDFQWTIKGKEGVRLFKHEQVWPASPYNKNKDFRRYELKDDEKPKRFTSNPKQFFMFFPNDYHQCMLEIGGRKSNIRKVIVKIEYIP